MKNPLKIIKFIFTSTNYTGIIFLILFWLVINSNTLLTEKPKDKDPFAKVDRAKVDEAINKGASYLLTSFHPLPPPITLTRPDYGKEDYDTSELVLYTLTYAGTDRTSPAFKTILEHVLTKKLEHTYNVVLTAMVLQTLDPIKYQDRIAECAQFLVDNQCPNGQWSYGNPVPPRIIAATSINPSPDPPKNAGATKTVKMIQITKRQNGPATGDNSNTQYACLGLRACMQARITIPDDVFKLIKTWFEANQNDDGGWSYGPKGLPSFGSMTAGALGSLIICDFYLNKLKDTQTVTSNKKIQKGLDWIINNFTVKENPKSTPPERWHYYWLYAAERLGAFLETETFGPHEWYPKGVEYLLAKQEIDGSWNKNVVDTCFAILFLKRATPPLVRIITK
jgi:hypothetical protein